MEKIVMVVVVDESGRAWKEEEKGGRTRRWRAVHFGSGRANLGGWLKVAMNNNVIVTYLVT